MISRRAVIRGLQLLGGMTIATAGGARIAAAQSAAPAPFAGFAALAEADPAAGQINAADLPGLPCSGGVFDWVAASPGQPPADGAVRVASTLSEGGHWRRRDYCDGVVRPEWFARPDDADPALAIQRAIDFVEREGRGRVDLGSRTYACRARIVMDITRCALTGSGATLDFAAREEPPESAAPPIADLGTLAAAVLTGGWTATGAGLEHAHGQESTVTLDTPLDAGQRYRIEMSLPHLDTEPLYPYLLIEFLDASGNRLASRRVLEPGFHTFEYFWTDVPAARMRIVTNARTAIAGFRLTRQGPTESLLVRATPDSPRLHHLWIDGVHLSGPGDARPGTTLDGIRFETRASTKSSRGKITNVSVSGFRHGVVLSDRAYLLSFHGCRLAENRVALMGLTDVSDGGENISLHACTLGDGDTGIVNGGAGINMFGCSIDYVNTFYRGTGSFTATGCHFEKRRTTSPDDYMFDVYRGLVHIDGCSMLISGEDFDSGNEGETVFNLRTARATAHLTNIWAWNLRSASQALAGGPGHLVVHGLTGDSTRHIAPLPHLSQTQNILGPASLLETEDLLLDMFLSAATQAGRTATGTGRARRVTGNGPPALEVEKTAARGEPLDLWLMGPCQPDVEIGFRLDYLLEGLPVMTSAECSIVFAQVIGREADGRPRIGGMLPARAPWGLQPSYISWQTLTGTTGTASLNDPGFGRAPAFTTHAALRIDLGGLGAGDKFYLRNPFLARR